MGAIYPRRLVLVAALLVLGFWWAHRPVAPPVGSPSIVIERHRFEQVGWRVGVMAVGLSGLVALGLDHYLRRSSTATGPSWAVVGLVSLLGGTLPGMILGPGLAAIAALVLWFLGVTRLVRRAGPAWLLFLAGAFPVAWVVEQLWMTLAGWVFRIL